MIRKGMHITCAVLALSSMPLHAATRINSNIEGGKGSAIVTPIRDSIEDVMQAAADANSVAARANTILDLDAYPMVVDLPALTAAPLSTSAIPSVAPAAVAGTTDALSYLPLAGLVLIPILLGGGNGDGGNTPPDVGQPSNPGGGLPPVPVPAVPEPTTWLMLLLGFGAIGAMLRASRDVSRRPQLEG